MDPQPRLYREPAGPPPADTPPFKSNDATVRAIILWHQNNAARKVASKEGEDERRRIWKLFCDHRADPSTQQAFGDRVHDTCKPFELLNFINAYLGDAADWTRRRWNTTIQAPFNAAEKLQLITKNPFRGLTFPQGNEGRDWTRDEFLALLRAAKLQVRRIIVLIRFSGLRPGEVRNLLWSDIRVDGQSIVIEKHKTRHKTKKPRRIPLNRVIYRVLALQKGTSPPNSKHVFLNSFGRPWSCKALTKAIAKLRKRTNLPDDVKLHGGRHTFATGAVMNHVPIPALMQMLGHKQLATTQRYLHVGDKVDHLAEEMEQAIRPRPKPAKKQQRDRPEPPTPLFDGLP